METEYRLRLKVWTAVDVDRDALADAVEAAVEHSTAAEALSEALGGYAVDDLTLELIDEKAECKDCGHSHDLTLDVCGYIEEAGKTREDDVICACSNEEVDAGS